MLINFGNTPNGSQNFGELEFWQSNFGYQPISPQTQPESSNSPSDVGFS